MSIAALQKEDVEAASGLRLEGRVCIILTVMLGRNTACHIPPPAYTLPFDGVCSILTVMLGRHLDVATGSKFGSQDPDTLNMKKIINAMLDQWHHCFHFACCDLVAFVTSEFDLVGRLN